MKNEHLEEQEQNNITEEEVSNNATNASEEEGLNEEKETSNEDQTVKTDESAAEQTEEERLSAELAESKDKYLRLYSEFENFRRRTAKEKLDLIATASEDIVSNLLPVLDDFERAQESNKEADADTMREGFGLIYNKLKNILEQKGLKPMNAGEGTEFDPELHEAITQIPAPKKKLQGKVVDVIEKGYYLGEKVIRFAKVVIGAKNE